MRISGAICAGSRIFSDDRSFFRNRFSTFAISLSLTHKCALISTIATLFPLIVFIPIWQSFSKNSGGYLPLTATASKRRLSFRQDRKNLSSVFDRVVIFLIFEVFVYFPD